METGPRETRLGKLVSARLATEVSAGLEDGEVEARKERLKAWGQNTQYLFKMAETMIAEKLDSILKVRCLTLIARIATMSIETSVDLVGASRCVKWQNV